MVFFNSKVRKVLLMMCFVFTSILLVNSCKDRDQDSDESPGGFNLKIEGVNGPTLSYSTEYLTITAVFENIELIGGLRYAIPEYRNSYIEIDPDAQSSGTLMNIHVAIEDLEEDNLENLPSQKLPGGRSLPGVVSGQLPAVSFTIESFKGMSFYRSTSLFGVFIPLDIDLNNAMVTAHFFSHGKKVGLLTRIGRDTNGENSGFLLMLNLDTVDEEVQDYLDSSSNS